MSGVVLRCPNCGTTRATPGECDACHEADARYYCTNHTPGRWLDAASPAAAACPQCGAVFGAPARPPAPIPTPIRRPRTTTVPTRGRSGGAPAPAPTPMPVPPSARYGAPPAVDRDPVSPDDGADGRMPRWQELLLAAARARSTRRESPLDMEDARPPRSRGGCLFRLILIVVFLFVALSAAPVLLGGALLRMLGGGF